MNNISFFRLAIATVGTMAVSGCLGTGVVAVGGGGGTPKNKAAYKTEFDRVSATIPTSDMPTKLNANYVGVAQMDLVSNAGGGTVGDVLADLDLNVDWTDGQVANPWSGKADNIRGTFNGTDFTSTGELTVAAAEAKGLPSTVLRTANTINTPVGPVTVATGAAAINLSGPLTVGSDSGDVLLALGGNMLGSGGTAMTGTAQTLWFDKNSGFGDVSGAGTFYAEKK